MKIPFIKSANFTKGRGGKKVRLIVIHTMETPETAGRAKSVAEWFKRNVSRKSSVHFCVDNKSIISTVPTSDTAYAVGQWDANQSSISIELAGKASQTPLQWKDAYSRAELKNAADLVARLCKEFNIPIVKVSASRVRTAKGICGHNDITAGYKVTGGHTDPGKNFPWKDFIKMVKDASAKLNDASVNK